MSRLGSPRVRKVLRVAWIPLVTGLVAVALAAGIVSVMGTAETVFRSTLVVLVPAAPPQEPEAVSEDPGDAGSTTSTTVYDPLGRPSEAFRAATNYAELIPQDRQIRTLVAEATGLDDDEVLGRIAASAVPDSALIVVTFEAPTERASAAGIEAIQSAVVGETPATPTIPSQSLIVVSTEEPEAVGGSALVTLVSAGVLGLAFGILLAVVWSRSAARVDSARDLAGVVEAPLVEVDELTPGRAASAVAALLRAADDASPDGQHGGVAVLSSTPAADSVLRSLHLLARAGGGPGEDRLVLGGLAGTRDAAGAVLSSESVVLAVVRGDRLARVREAVAEVGRLGRSVASVLVLPERAAPVQAGTHDSMEGRGAEGDDHSVQSSGAGAPTGSDAR